MSYLVKLDDPAKKEFAELPGYIRAQALQFLRLLRDQPRPSRAKELRGKPDIYRVWLAGSWRIAYYADDDQQMVLVLRVRRKEDIEYDSLVSPE